MKYYFMVFIFGVLIAGCQVKVKTGSESETDELIDISSIRANLEFLSSDELEGRETGSNGEKVASQFIASELKSFKMSLAFDFESISTIPDVPTPGTNIFEFFQSGIISKNSNV